MSDNEVTLGISVPLDSDGFLRRECPTCEGEFKWLPSGEDDSQSTETPDGGYFCPYCAIQAPPDSWLTQAQAELAQNLVSREVVEPMLKDFTRDINRPGRRSRGLLRMSGRYDVPDALDPLTEADGMRRVDFDCHPTEPVKILDDWDGPVHCLICGETAP
jgi:hypothetical protein